MRILNLIVMLIFSLILSYYFPIFLNLFLPEYGISQRVRYSPVIDKFLLSSTNKLDGKTNYMIIGDGNISEDQFIQNQPFTYSTVLIPKGKFPQIFSEYAKDQRLIVENSQSLSLKYASNKARYIQLYPILDVNEKFSRVIYSPFFLRLGSERGVEILDIAKNAVDVNASMQINELLTQNGFKFPAKHYFSNPSVMKEFDEGGFIVSDDDRLFHLKFRDGKFSVSDTQIVKKEIINMVVSENARREFYGILICKNELGLVDYDYKFIPLPMDKYDAYNTNLALKITPVYKSVAFTSRNEVQTHVMDLNYTLKKQNLTKFAEPVSKRHLKNYFLPFETNIIQKNSGELAFEFSKFSIKSIAFSLILAFGFFMYNAVFKRRKFWLESGIIAIFGLYGFIAVMFYKKDK